MRRLLVAPGVGPGHVLQGLAIAQALREQGHRVVLYAEREAARDAARAGCRFVEMPARGAADRFRRCRTTRQVTQAYLAVARQVAPDMLSVLARERIDGVVTDVLHLGASLAAERSGLPWASLATAPVLLTPVMDRGAQAQLPTGPLRRKLGLPPTRKNSFRQGLSPALTLLSWTREFDLGPVPRGGEHVGPLNWESPDRLAPPWVKRLGSRRPAVLVGVSTNSFDALDDDVERYVSEAIVALNRLPVDGVVTLGTGKYAIREAPRRHVRVERFLNHGLLMPRLRAVVTHGGWGTIGRALTHGVPMVIVPNCLDQPLNAQVCEAKGFGFSIELSEVTADLLEARLRKLLSEESQQRRRVARVSRAIVRLHTNRTAAKLVLAL